MDTSLLIENLSDKINKKMLFNLFSIYGFIYQIAIQGEGGVGLVFFLNQVSVEVAITHLDNVSVFDQKLSLKAVSHNLEFHQQTDFQSRDEFD